MKNFIKNKYNILIPVCLVVVLLIAILLYAKEYKNNRYAELKEVDVYQYFSGVKMEYTANIGRNRKNVILEYENEDFAVNLDTTPIYIKETGNVIFPKEMSIVFPLKDKQYRVNALSEIYEENKLYYLNIRNFNNVLENIFYYDGNNLYFFVEGVTLIVGDKEISLSPMSYVSCSYQNFVEYYDKEHDIFETINITNEKVTGKNEYMTIDIASDKVVYKDSFSLLIKDFSTLNKITDIED